MKRKWMVFILLSIVLVACSLLTNPLGNSPDVPQPVEQIPSGTETQDTGSFPTSTDIPREGNFSPVTLENAQNLVEIASISMENPGLIAWLPDTYELVVRSHQRVSVLHGENLTTIHEFTLPENTSVLAFNPARQWMALSSDRLTLSIQDLSGKEIWTLAPPGGFGSAGFDPDGSHIWLTSMDDFLVTAYEIETGNESSSCDNFETAAPVYSAYPSTGGKWLIWTARATIQLDNLPDCRMTARIGHEDFISTFVLNHGESVLATSAGGTLNDEFTPLIFLWDPGTGQPVGNIILQETPAISLAFSSDDTLLASAGAGLIIWNATMGEEVVTLAPLEQRYTSVLFSDEGRYLAAATETEIRVFAVKH